MRARAGRRPAPRGTTRMQEPWCAWLPLFRVIGGNLEERRRRFGLDDVLQLIRRSTEARVAVRGFEEQFEIVGVPPLADHFEFAVVADRAGGNGDGNARTFRGDAVQNL